MDISQDIVYHLGGGTVLLFGAAGMIWLGILEQKGGFLKGLDQGTGVKIRKKISDDEKLNYLIVQLCAAVSLFIGLRDMA